LNITTISDIIITVENEITQEVTTMDNRHYFNPTPGTIYENKGGGSYICLSRSGHYEAEFQRMSKSKWTFTAHGCQMYEDGTIEWDGSTGGYFAED
jgi:hypothetical protein